MSLLVMYNVVCYEMCYMYVYHVRVHVRVVVYVTCNFKYMYDYV